jgi:methylglutaconyl-CoA hydratase
MAMNSDTQSNTHSDSHSDSQLASQSKKDRTKAVSLTTDARGVATVTLQRAEMHNAFDDVMIAELIQLLDKVKADEICRVLVLRAMGKSFSAGADLNWMRRMADYDQDQNLSDARELAKLMKTLNQLTIPTIALVQGASFGGGVGLVACCDIAIASDNAVFCLSEVRLGLIPAVISPYVIAAIGERQARRYFLTAEKFNASKALSLGLVHEVVDTQALDSRLGEMIEAILSGGPQAQKAAKHLVFSISKGRVSQSEQNDDLIEETVKGIAAIRATDEAREGLSAFLEKRRPKWVQG